MENLYSVLVRPVVTEKSMASQSLGKYVFFVSAKATKIDIQNAVEKLYSVHVKAVNVLPVREKTRLVARGRSMTKRSAAIKAVVTLKKGETLDTQKIQEEKKSSTKSKSQSK